MLFSVNRLVSAWLSNISVQKGWGVVKEAFYSVLNGFNLNPLEWNRRSMGESDCFVISIYYWIGLQQDSVPAVSARARVCADLFKGIMVLRLCTVYAHRLTFSVLRLLCPLHVLLSTFALFCSVIAFPCSRPAFISTRLLSSIDTSIPISLSTVYQTHNCPSPPKPAESPTGCAQTDGWEWWWATTAADSGSDQQHDCSKSL